MRTRKPVLLTVVLGLMLSACGVEVGNGIQEGKVPPPPPANKNQPSGSGGGSSPSFSGSVAMAMTSYSSLKHGFGFKYRKELTLREESENRIQVDNSSYAKFGRGPADEQRKGVSTIIFEVRQLDGVETVDQLEGYLKTHYKNYEFKRVAINGSTALASERRSDSELVAKYFFLGSGGEVVEVDLDVVKYANGLAWIAPIVHTFSYDIAGPTILEVKPEESTVVAGEKGRLLFRATDDLSGIDGARIEFGLPGTELSISDYNSYDDLEVLGDDWYAVEYQAGEFLKPGDYQLKLFISYDKAGNWTEEYGEEISATITVVNEGPVDAAGPTLLEVKPEESTVVAGEKGRLLFRATDDLSGIDGAHIEFGLPGTELSISDYNSYDDLEVLGDDWYAVEYQAGEFLKPGDYQLKLFISYDKAGNWTEEYGEEISATITVVNEGPVDAAGPTLLEVKPEESTVVAGEKGRLLFRATDDLSGIDGARIEFGLPGTELSISDYNSYDDLEVLGDDWYAVEYQAGEFLKPGDYQLKLFISYDKAGNWTEEYGNKIKAQITVTR